MLPLHVKPMHRETLPSFLSRMAAVNGCRPGQFAMEMGFSMKRILNLDPAATKMLCGLAGLEEQEQAELVSWTGFSIGNVRMRFREEVFVSRALRDPKTRGCPECLREDAAGTGNPLTLMGIRGHWQLRGNDLCLRHGRALVPLWTAQKPGDRHDISGRLEECLEDILSGACDGPLAKPTAYDFWLDQRLQDGTDTTWLATQELYPAITFCRLLGAELLRIKGLRETGEVRAAPLGFTVAQHGPDAITDALSEILSAAEDTVLEPRGGYGQLYTHLDRDHRDEPAFDPFRNILRSHILRNWATGAGDTVLGQPVQSRRLHSLSSASKETGIGPALLDALLTEAGAFEPGDARVPRRKTFDAEDFSELLKDIPRYVGHIAMQNTIGATRAELRTLEQDGVLARRTQIPAAKSPWSISDGRALVSRLRHMATLIAPAAEGWIHLQAARKRSGISLDRLLGAAEKGVLNLGIREGIEGYHAFIVRLEDVDRLSRKAKIRPAGEELVPAAAFGRSIGLRGKQGFVAFVEDGHTPTRKAAHPPTGQVLHYLSQEDAAAFHSRFLTVRSIASQTGKHQNTVLAALRHHGAERFTPDGKDYGPVYLRTAVQRILANLE